MATLSGKVAMVTGASRGIGAAIAKRLAREGASVAITYARSGERAKEVIGAIQATGARALSLRADSADGIAVTRAVADTVSTFGRIDILVNNAGIISLPKIDELTLDDFDKVTAVNVRAVFAAIRAAVRHMQPGARIITIGSINSERVPFQGGSLYVMTKAAVAGLTRGLARELAARGITINTIQPGPIASEANPENSDFATMLKSLTAQGRYGRGDDVAGLVAYLAGPEAGFVTGASLNIDGGFAV
jgi:3-oxoacyl-[acyl-carrier protein] reductase